MDGAPTLAEALAMFDEEIHAAQAEVSTLQAKVTRLQAEVAKLKLERQVVEDALRRFRDKSTPSRPPFESAPSGEASSSDRQPVEQAGSPDTPGLTSQVRDLLRAAEQPLSIAEIVKETDLDSTQARSALGYLRRRGEAHRVGHGLWGAGAPTDTEAVPAPAGTASAPLRQQMKGGGASGTDGVRDLDPLQTTLDRNHHYGAPVGAPN